MSLFCFLTCVSADLKSEGSTDLRQVSWERIIYVNAQNKFDYLKPIISLLFLNVQGWVRKAKLSQNQLFRPGACARSTDRLILGLLAVQLSTLYSLGVRVRD